MRILIINPNTSGDFTDKIRHIATQYAEPSTEITALNPSSGPRSIESIYDELLSSPGSLELAIAQLDKCDAVMMACYSDHPTIHAIREITPKPVVGIAEATMHLACMLGDKFSIVTTNAAWEPLLWHAVRRYGLTERCASVRATGLPVLALEGDNQQNAESQILDQARRAVQEDGADVICLGCAGMAGMDKEMEKALDVPVLDGVVCALKLLEGMVRYGVKTSKRRAYGRPQYKELVNLPGLFSGPYAH